MGGVPRVVTYTNGSGLTLAMALSRGLTAQAAKWHALQCSAVLLKVGDFIQMGTRGVQKTVQQDCDRGLQLFTDFERKPCRQPCHG